MTTTNFLKSTLTLWFQHALSNRFIRFLLIGGVNTLFGYGVYALLILIHLHYAAAMFFSVLAGVLFNFKTIGKFVFQSHNNQLIFRFIGVYAFLYVLQISALKGFSYLNIGPLIGGAILLLPSAILSFLLNRRFVFHHH